MSDKSLRLALQSKWEELINSNRSVFRDNTGWEVQHSYPNPPEALPARTSRNISNGTNGTNSTSRASSRSSGTREYCVNNEYEGDKNAMNDDDESQIVDNTQMPLDRRE